MTDHNDKTGSSIDDEIMRATLKRQYLASLAMLRQAVEKCPEDLWLKGDANPFWQNAYHTLFFTHHYLMPDLKSFQPWERHREEYQKIGAAPDSPDDPPKIGEPYTKEDVLEYCQVCEDMIDGAVDALDLLAQQCGFHWYKMPKLEHQIMNIRHLQHHAGQLADRLRVGSDKGVGWKGTSKQGKPDE